MESIYLAFVDTPGIFSAVLHRFLKQKYIHVVLSMDSELDEAYSFGRRNPAIPLLAGFEKEDKEKIWKAFPDAGYQVSRVSCSAEQKQHLWRRLFQDYERRFRLHYAVAGLPLIALGIPCPIPGQFTCSSYTAKLLTEAGIWNFGKHYSLVTPKDFLEHDGREIIFEGKLAELLRKSDIPETEAVYG